MTVEPGGSVQPQLHREHIAYAGSFKDPASVTARYLEIKPSQDPDEGLNYLCCPLASLLCSKHTHRLGKCMPGTPTAGPGSRAGQGCKQGQRGALGEPGKDRDLLRIEMAQIAFNGCCELVPIGFSAALASAPHQSPRSTLAASASSQSTRGH